ncbi:MAG TPA: guanylate kinase [Aquifex aeolicus]|uniref:Guanylate kinase n=1 Tax=Aquifex aeolicus TaxID=63363 RepID=A0A9D0YPD6_AQUAO|nr:guanylate kinase [Aquificales bacterium]HIP98027.1 guanylate kinase [Aquifex aeolicus]HIQ26064.1 guanylate kinase [Aquifex aeolicus]
MYGGFVYILSAPSGAGKTTVGNLLLREVPYLEKVITVTTRSPREGEKHGVDYYFLSEDEFLKKIEKGEFLEWARVYRYYYGTPKSEVERILSQGKDALLIIDVQGAFQVKEKFPNAVSIFLLPPSLGELKKRLTLRGEREIEERLEWAKKEIPCAKHFDYVVVNNVLEKAVEEIKSIMLSNRRKAAFVFNNENYQSLHLGEDILQVIKGEDCHGNKKV